MTDACSLTVMNEPLLAKLLEASGLRESELAHRLEISDRTMRRYVSGYVAVPRVVYFATLYLIEEQRRELQYVSR